jgi:hypothetical protein
VAAELPKPPPEVDVDAPNALVEDCPKVDVPKADLEAAPNPDCPNPGAEDVEPKAEVGVDVEGWPNAEVEAAGWPNAEVEAPKVAGLDWPNADCPNVEVDGWPNEDVPKAEVVPPPNADVEGAGGEVTVIAGTGIPDADLESWKAASNAPLMSLETRLNWALAFDIAFASYWLYACGSITRCRPKGRKTYIFCPLSFFQSFQRSDS